MPDWFPASRFGAVLAALYAGFAIWVVVQERTTTGGGWISLRGMGSALVTAPVSLPLEMIGVKLSYTRNLDMGVAILACAALVYLLGAGVAALIAFIANGRAP